MNATTKWSWRDAPELMARLQRAQNAPKHAFIDIMTIVGFMRSEAELVAHVERYEANLQPLPGRYWSKTKGGR